MSTVDIEMKMPDLSTASDEVKVVTWHVRVGEPVKRGQVLLEVETDKSAMEVESIADGVLKAILVEPDTSVAAGAPIAVIAGRGSPSAGSAKREVAPAPAEEATVSAAAPQRRGGMFDRNRARVAQPAGGTTMTPAQQVVARRMTESKQNIPHFYLHRSFNAEPLIAQREAAGTEKPVWDAYFVQAAARALGRFAQMRRRVEGTQLIPLETEGVGVAVDVEGDLYVLTVDGAAAKTIATISAEIRAGVARLRAGDSAAKKMRPALMTVTNLGGSGIDAFMPIVNPPEAAILGIGRIAPQPVVADGAVIVQRRGTLTLSVDHRVVNGRYAASFLAEIAGELETLETDVA